jgi:hypothetical protein
MRPLRDNGYSHRLITCPFGATVKPFLVLREAPPYLARWHPNLLNGLFNEPCTARVNDMGISDAIRNPGFSCMYVMPH